MIINWPVNWTQYLAVMLCTKWPIMKLTTHFSLSIDSFVLPFLYLSLSLSCARLLSPSVYDFLFICGVCATNGIRFVILLLLLLIDDNLCYDYNGWLMAEHNFRSVQAVGWTEKYSRVGTRSIEFHQIFFSSQKKERRKQLFIWQIPLVSIL